MYQGGSNPNADDSGIAEQRAVALLGRREHSAWELRNKLVQKGFNRSVVSDVVKVLQERDWQSDTRFAESFIRQRIAVGYGPVRIRSELSQKGVSDAVIESGIASQDVNWTELAREKYQRKFGDSPCDDPKERARRLRYMAQRGFTREQVLSAVF